MKIFISSTYEDLKEHRRAVRDAILRLGHHPIGMEDFGSRPEEWNRAALDALNGCGALVGIYAHRYGSIPPDETRSITEQEFDRARALRIPCFCYRVDPDYPWPPRFIDHGDAKQNLERFLQKVDALLRSTFTTPDDLAKKVSADLGRELKESTPRAALHSIPSPLPDFIGRAHEIAQLVTNLTPSPSTGEVGAVITGIAGMGGIGKTQLAYVVAHQIAAHYPDAQILVDCRGTAKPPPPPSELMRQIIHTFEPTADLRQAPDADIAALYRALLNGKRALILLDNAADAAQVKPLLPPPGCALLITSRRYFVLPGLSPLRLDVMPPAEATALLLEICPRLATAVGAADEIARLCGYLPLALRIAGSALAEHTDLAPARYIERLRAQRLKVLKSPDDPEGDVEATLESSYTLLTPETQTRWRALAVFPASFDVAAAAWVWELDEDAAFDTLSELVRLSLLNYTTADDRPPTAIIGRQSSVIGRYSMHDLLRDLAETRLSDTERDTAHLRHALHYVEVARTADELYLQGGDAVLRGLALFDAEWQNIRAGQAWAAARMETSEDATRLCNYYASAAVYCLALRLHPRERIAWLETALAAARKLGKKEDEGNHLGNLGLAYAALGETRQAIAYYERALAIDREIGDRRGEGADLGNLGLAYADLGETRQAIAYYEQALAIAREIGDRRGEGNRLGNLGLAYAALGETRQAIAYYEQALAIAREIGDRRGEGNRLGNLGNAYAALGETRQAIAYYEQALAIAREIGDRRGEGNRLGNLGLAYAALGETRQAIAYYEQALAIAREIGDRRGEGIHLGNLGNAYYTLGETRQAIAYYEQALAIDREIGDRRGEGADLGNLGNAYAALGETRQAIAFTEEALKIFEAIESPYAERARRQLAWLRGGVAS